MICRLYKEWGRSIRINWHVKRFKIYRLVKKANCKMVCYRAMEHNNDMLVYGKFSLKKHQHSLNAGCVSGSGLSTLHVLSHLFSSGS